MRHFFLESLDRPVLTGAEAYHAARVLRLRPGEHVAVSDGSGHTAEAEVAAVGDEEVALRLLAVCRKTAEAPLAVHVFQGMAKGEKMDLVLQKAVELGAAFFRPFAAARSVVRLDGAKAAARQERWERIALEAAKQCRRSLVPQVAPLLPLAEALQALPAAAVLLVLYEQEEACGLKEALRQLAGRVQDVALLIGPEGGLTPQEVALAVARGGRVVRMGPRILRTETAAIAATAVVMYELGDLGGTSCQG